MQAIRKMYHFPVSCKQYIQCKDIYISDIFRGLVNNSYEQCNTVLLHFRDCYIFLRIARIKSESFNALVGDIKREKNYFLNDQFILMQYAYNIKT